MSLRLAVREISDRFITASGRPDRWASCRVDLDSLSMTNGGGRTVSEGCLAQQLSEPPASIQHSEQYRKNDGTDHQTDTYCRAEAIESDD
jgi:hypothetical protein